MKYLKNQKGFSLVEVIFVIVILAIISTIAIATYPQLVQNSKVKTDKMSAGNIARALRSWYEDGVSSPQTSDEFKEYITNNLYLKTVKLSELEAMDVATFVDPTTSPTSLLDSRGKFDEKQAFYVGIIGEGVNSKFVITVETEDRRLESLSADSVENYDGTSIGIIYIES